MDLVLLALAFHGATGIDWSSSGGSDDFIANDFATRTVHVKHEEKIAPVKLQKVNDAPVMPIMVTAIDVSWLLRVERKTIQKVERDYRRCLGIDVDDAAQQADVPAYVVHNFDDVFAQ